MNEIQTALMNFIYKIEDRRRVLDNLETEAPRHSYDPGNAFQKYCIEEEARVDKVLYESFDQLMGLVIDRHEKSKRDDERERRREKDR